MELRNRNEGTKKYSIMSFGQDPLKKFQKFVKILVRDKIDIRRRKEKK